uniref:Uncharacterized protein n=1 Tax=Meloidogyne enterolobii TaxID=390850 RepID=A0A6V7TPD3_MELEN|nr:unnamed protein product [Meloidogyne enterolobii]
MIQDQNQSDEMVKTIQNLVENEEVLRAKISFATIVEQKMNERLEQLRVLRKEEDDKMEAQKKQIEVLEKARYYAVCHGHNVETELKRKRTVMGEFKKLVENNSVANLASELTELDLIKEDFCSQRARAPWLPEKQKILGELKQHENQLASLQNEISRTDGLISEREDLLAKHKQLPFKNFCVTLANYLHKTRQMDNAMKNELKIQETLLEKTKRLEHEAIQKSLSPGINQDEEIDVVNVQEVVEKAPESNVERVVNHSPAVTNHSPAITVNRSPVVINQSPATADLSKTTQRSKFTPDPIEKHRNTPNRSVTDIIQTGTNDEQANIVIEQEDDLLMHFNGIDVFQTGGNEEGDDIIPAGGVTSNFSFGFNFNSPARGETTHNKDTQNEETFGFNFNF